MIITLVFSSAKNGFKSVISIVCQKYQFTFPNIHFAINCNNPMRFLSDNSQCATQRSDLIIIQSVWNDMKKQSKLRQTKSRRTVATSPRCFKKYTCKAIWKTMCKCTRAKTALNAKDGHNKYWFSFIEVNWLTNIFMTLFLTASSFYSIFTQVRKLLTVL